MNLDVLSPRELEVVTLLTAGHPQKAIAEDLRPPISISAVKVYVARAKAKLGARNVTHLVVLVTKAAPIGTHNGRH